MATEPQLGFRVLTGSHDHPSIVANFQLLCAPQRLPSPPHSPTSATPPSTVG